MRQFITIIGVCLLLSGQRSAAQITQKGLVREFNSGKQPLAGVSVQFLKAASTESDREGKFTLTFLHDKKAGDAISLMEVRKNGYEVVNETQLQSLRLSSDGILATDVVLAKSGVIATAKAEFAGVSLTSLIAGYEREKKNLIAKVNTAKIKEEEYNKQLQELNEEFEKQKTLIDKYAEELARINFDDVSKVYQEALVLFKNGKIKECSAKLDSLQLLDRADRRISNRNELKKKLQENDKGIREDLTLMELNAKAKILSFDLKTAESYYDKMLELDSTDLQIIEKTADFYREQHRYEKALKIYPKIIAHPQTKEWSKANAHYFMGDLYTTTGNLNRALESYTIGCDIYVLLNKVDSSPIDIDILASFYSKLGKTYTLLGNLNKALEFHEKALVITKELYNSYPKNSDFKYGLALNYANLGEIHKSLRNLDKAFSFNQKQTKMLKELYEVEPNNLDYKSNYSISIFKLGNNYFSFNSIDSTEKALQYYELHNKLQKELYDAFPSNINLKNYYAISFKFLGITNSLLGNIDKALEFYENENRLCKELNDSYPQNVEFKRNLAFSYFTLASIFLISDETKSKSYINEAIKLFDELVKMSPENVEIRDIKRKLDEMINFKATHIRNNSFQPSEKENEAKSSEIGTIAQYTDKKNKSQPTAKKNKNSYRKISENSCNENENLSNFAPLISSLDSLFLSKEEFYAKKLEKQAWCFLVSGKLLEAFKLVDEANKLEIDQFRSNSLTAVDYSELIILDQPLILLLMGEIEEAKTIYLEHAKMKSGKPKFKYYKDIFLSDLYEFEAAGIIPEQYKNEVEKIKKLLNEL